MLKIIQILLTAKIAFRDISIKKPTLEDVYLNLTKHDMGFNNEEGLDKTGVH